MRKPHREYNGFTLIEVIIVVMLVLILAATAIPNYVKAKERTLNKEAKAGLKLIRAAEKIKLTEDNAYYPSSGSEGTISTINTNLRLYLPTSSTRNWNYTVYASGSATAVRNGSDARTWTITFTGDNDPTCSGTTYCE